MNDVRIVLNREGVRELLKSQWMLDTCQELAQGVQTRCGEGYGTSAHVGRNRVNVSVYTETNDAVRDNSDNNTLLRALGGGN